MISTLFFRRKPSCNNDTQNMNSDETDLPRSKSLTLRLADDEDLKQLFQNDLEELEFLDIHATDGRYFEDIDTELFEPLFSGELFPKLSYFGLHFTSNTDEIVEALVKSKFWGRLDTLDLSCNELGDHGVRYLLKSKKTAWLRKLNLHDNRLTERSLAKLAELPCETDLRQRQDMDEAYNDDYDRYDSIQE